MIKTVHGHFLEQEGIIALDDITLHTKCYRTNRHGKMKESSSQTYNLATGEVAVVHSSCHVSIQLNGNHVALKPELRHRHKNTWISSVEVRNLRAEILISKVHKLAIEQQIATYQIKANTNTWYHES